MCRRRPAWCPVASATASYASRTSPSPRVRERSPGHHLGPDGGGRPAGQRPTRPARIGLGPGRRACVGALHALDGPTAWISALSPIASAPRFVVEAVAVAVLLLGIASRRRHRGYPAHDHAGAHVDHDRHGVLLSPECYGRLRLGRNAEHLTGRLSQSTDRHRQFPDASACSHHHGIPVLVDRSGRAVSGVGKARAVSAASLR